MEWPCYTEKDVSASFEIDPKIKESKFEELNGKMTGRILFSDKKNVSRCSRIQSRIGSRFWQADNSTRPKELERRFLLFWILFQWVFRGKGPRLQLLAHVRRQRPARPVQRDRADLHSCPRSRATVGTGLETCF